MKNIENQDRRNLLKGATVTAAAMALGATASNAAPHCHTLRENACNYQDVIDSTLQCVKDGRACLDHCIVLLKSGDLSMANCTETVNEMLVMCDAMSQMATYNSAYIKELAKICMKTCEDCERECAKHEKKHAECAACAKSCRACIKECKKIAA